MNDQKTVVAAFTEMASHYEGTVDSEIRQFWGVGYREFIRRFVGEMNLAGRERVLDIGTGMAAVPVTLLNHTIWSGEVVGLDITPEMLSRARQSLTGAGFNHRVRLVCGSGIVLPFSAGSFDAVTCALATHHMDVPTLLSEIRRVLRPHGQMLLADVALADFWSTRTGRFLVAGMAIAYRWTQGRVRAQAELDAMKNMLSPEEWRTSLQNAGFSGLNLSVLPARRRWYPPGVLMRARLDEGEKRVTRPTENCR